MALAAWWSSDPLPSLSPLPGFAATVASDAVSLARINRITADEVKARRAAGHRPYIGYLDAIPTAYGWVATDTASIGELGLTFRLSEFDRYLWDFATLPQWQGRGLYPRLLQAIIRQESGRAERFWIIHAPENTPSGAGMRKAGFAPVGVLSFHIDRSVGLAPLHDQYRAVTAAKLLGVGLSETVLAPCWCCHGTVERPIDEVDLAYCWPPRPFQATHCSCSVPLKPSAAAAA